MTTVRRIAKNTVFLLIGQPLGFGMGFLYLVYAARHLGAEVFGILSFAIAFTAIFGILADFGLQFLSVREVSRDKGLASKYLANLGAMKLLLSFAVFILIAAIINSMNYPAKTVTVVYIMALAVIVNCFTLLTYSIFQAFEKMEYISFGQVLNGAVLFMGALIATTLNLGVLGFALFFALAAFSSLFYGVIALRLKFPALFFEWMQKKAEVDRVFWTETVKKAFPIMLAAFFGTAFYGAPVVMLSLMKGDAEVGWFNAAYRIVFCLALIPNSLITALYPVMSVYHKTSQESLRLLHEKAFKYFTIAAAPILVATTFFADKVIFFIYGDGYANSVMPLKILVWSAVFIFMYCTPGNLFVCSDRQSVSMKINGICLVISVVSNIILIPGFGFIGASVATMVTDFSYLLLVIAWGRKIGQAIPERKLAGILLKVAAGGSIMSFYMMALRDLNIAVLLPSALLVYLMILYASNAIDKEDLNLFKLAVRREGL